MRVEETSQRRAGVFPRIFRTLSICLCVALSLLCFPHWLPWMFGFWILWHTYLVARGSPGYWPLLACVIIAMIRLVPHTPAMLAFGAALILTAGWRMYFRADLQKANRLRWIAVASLGSLWILLFVEYRLAATCNRDVTLDSERPIVCIGDSLTDGMLPDRGYPAQLASMVRVPVINKGVSGIATGPAIGILERALKEHPQAVIIELGGHDFLKWHRRSSTKANLEKMIRLCRENDCEPILMEIPRGFIIDPYASLERELAYEFDLQLIDDRWLRHIVLMSPSAPPGRWFPSAQLSDDGIHSNPKGSLAIAQFAADALTQLYGDAILKPSQNQ